MTVRRRFYDAYVSSGQGGRGSGRAFGPTQPYLRRLVARHVPPDRGVALLDLGCGAGGLIAALKAAGYRNVRGCDDSPEMVAAAHAAGLAEVVRGDLLGMLAATADASCDVVFLMDVLEHLEDAEMMAAADGARRVLRPGGRLIAHVPNGEGLFGGAVRYGDLTHVRAFTAQSLRQLLRTAGFRSLSCFEDRPVPHGPASALRRLVWDVGTLPHRLLSAAETGRFDAILSRNLLVVAEV